MGVIALVAVAGIAATAFQLDPNVLNEVSASPTGLWVPAPATGEILYVDVASQKVAARVEVGEPGAELDIEERDEAVVVVDRTAGQVMLVDPGLQVIDRTVAVPTTNVGPVDIGPDAIVVGAETQLSIVDPEVANATTTDLAGAPRSVAADGAGAVAEDGTEQLRVDSEGAVSGARPSPGPLVRVGDEVFVVGTDGIENRAGGRVACLESPVAQPDHVVGSDDGLVVVVEGDLVQIADLGNGTCEAEALDDEVGPLGRPVVAAGHVFVPEPAAGVVHIIEPSRGVVESPQVFAPGGDIRVRSRGDFVVAYDATNELVALLDPTGEPKPVDTIAVALDAEGEFAAPVSTDDDQADPADDDDGASSDAPDADATVLGVTINNLVEPEDQPPVDDDVLAANFAYSASTVVVGDPVRVVDRSTGSPEAWLWDFGDGTGAEGPEAEKAWDQPGTYLVSLQVSRGQLTAQIAYPITVVPVGTPLPPAADFVASSTIVAVGGRISFEDRSDGAIDRWRWEFGDGTGATDRSVTHSWDEPGTYRVRLTVANQLGSDTAEIDIQVIDDLQAPVAVITVAETTVGQGSPLRFQGSSSTDPATFVWDFGDGTASVGPDVQHVFVDQGTFAVELTASNGAGSSTETVEIVVTAPTSAPIAAIAELPDVIEVGDLISLSSLSTNGPDLESWTFGDGQTAEGQSVTHAWTSPGEYSVTLTASNAAGSGSVAVSVVVVAELPAPVARIGTFNAAPWVGEPTIFADGLSINATSWLWDFGDGVTSTSPNSLHTFTTSGPKVVTLTVSNRNGSGTASVVVVPRLRPIADFIVSSTAPRAGEAVTFTDTSVNASGWLWNFGDGFTSDAQNPMHTYVNSGSYSVSLTVSNDLGDTATTVPRVITVDPARPLLTGIYKIPDNTATITTANPTSFLAQVAVTSGPTDLYEIDFGDGSAVLASPSPQFSHTYGTAGNYTVQMRARGPLGDWSEWVARAFTVVDPALPAVDFTAPPTAQLGTTVSLAGIVLPGSGPISSWRWEVIRGGIVVAPKTGQFATHTFDAVGPHTIRLIATGPVQSTQFERTITITPPPPPTITALNASTTTPTVGSPVAFFPVLVGGPVETWEWNFDGLGYQPGGPIGVHTFSTAGPHTVSVRVIGPGGQDERALAVSVSPRPVPAQPSGLPSAPVVTGTATTLSSSDTGGLTGLTWSWQITLNGVAVAAPAGQSIPFTFSDPGTWSVAVTATDANGISGSSDPVTVIVVDPLVADFTPAVAGLAVQFTDMSGPGVIDSWSWDFGDGTTSDLQNPTHTYPAAGGFPVALTVTSGGQSDLITLTVIVG